MEDAWRVAGEIGAYPLIIRPAFTLGGSGGGIAYNKEEFDDIAARGLDLSPVSEVLIEESLLGLERIRNGGDARLQGQLRGHLLH